MAGAPIYLPQQRNQNPFVRMMPQMMQMFMANQMRRQADKEDFERRTGFQREMAGTEFDVSAQQQGRTPLTDQWAQGGVQGGLTNPYNQKVYGPAPKEQPKIVPLHADGALIGHAAIVGGTTKFFELPKKPTLKPEKGFINLQDPSNPTNIVTLRKSDKEVDVLLNAGFSEVLAPQPRSSGTVTLEDPGDPSNLVTLRRSDPEVDRLLGGGFREVRTPESTAALMKTKAPGPDKALDKVAQLTAQRAKFDKTGNLDAITAQLFPQFKPGKVTQQEKAAVYRAFDSAISYYNKYTPDGMKRQKAEGILKKQNKPVTPANVEYIMSLM